MRSKTFHSGKASRRVALALMSVMALLIPAPLATAASSKGDDRPSLIKLPGASGAEGIAAGEGSTFYAGDINRGDIFRGNIREGTAELFIHAPKGRMAVGMKVDRHDDLLFVAGGPTGQAYVYDTESGKTVATYQLTVAKKTTFINDVTLTSDGAWFTNSGSAELYFVPVNDDGKPGPAKTLKVTGPASDTSSTFNFNGIAAVRGGRTLVVAHTGKGALYTVDPENGKSALIAGVSVPNVDGILTSGRTLWAVQNQNNQISRIRLDSDLSSGRVREVIKSPDFKVPTTVARFGDTLAVVNAKFGVPGANTFEVVLVDARS